MLQMAFIYDDMHFNAKITVNMILRSVF